MYFDKICISNPCLQTIVILKVENMVLTNLVKPQNNFESAELRYLDKGEGVRRLKGPGH